jgi:hypothetical protein
VTTRRSSSLMPRPFSSAITLPGGASLIAPPDGGVLAGLNEADRPLYQLCVPAAPLAPCELPAPWLPPFPSTPGVHPADDDAVTMPPPPWYQQ